MGEFVPLFIGIAIGLAGTRAAGLSIATCAQCAAAGAIAWCVNGELGDPWLIALDFVEVLAAALMTSAVVRRVLA